MITISNTDLADLVKQILTTGKVGTVTLTPVELEQLTFEVADAIAFIAGGKVEKSPHLKGDAVVEGHCTVIIHPGGKRDLAFQIWKQFSSGPEVQVSMEPQPNPIKDAGKKRFEDVLYRTRRRVDKLRGRGEVNSDEVSSYRLT